MARDDPDVVYNIIQGGGLRASIRRQILPDKIIECSAETRHIPILI